MGKASGDFMKDCVDHLVTLYQEHLDLGDTVFSRIDHEDAMVAIVYKITRPNGEQLILKISERSNDFLREVYLLKLFAGILPVPKIIRSVEPTEDIHGAILMEHLSGNLLKAEELTEVLAYEIGRCLALIHLNQLPGYGDPIQRDLSSDPNGYFTLKFEEGIDECKHHLPKKLIEQCQTYYKESVNFLASVDGPCIVHRDFRPGNIIVHEGRLQGIIDWAGARSSFAEEDFCSIEHGEWSNNSYIKKPFLAGYAEIRPVPNYTGIIPFLRLNKAIATIGFTVKRKTWNNRDSRIYQHNLQFLENLFEGNL